MTRSHLAVSLPAATALLLGATCGGCSGVATPSPFDGWRILRMKARAAAVLSGGMEMRLGSELDKSVLTTRTTASLLGARLASSETRTVLDPVSGRPESYQMTSPRRGRRYAFDAKGYSVEKLRPSGDLEAPLDDWEVRSTKRFAYPVDAGGAIQAVFDCYGMLLHLRRLPLDRPGDEATLFVATSDGPLPFRITVAEERNSRQAYEDLRSSRPRSVDVREFRLRITPADPARADEGFMNMVGETELWVDAETKTPLSLSGRVRNVPGTVTLELAALG